MQCVSNQTRKLAAEFNSICNFQSPCKRQSINATKLSHFRGFSLIFVAQLLKQSPFWHSSKSRVLQYSDSAKINLHTKTEKKMLTKMRNLNHSRPRQRCQNLIGMKPTQKCVYFEINGFMCVLIFSRCFHYRIGSMGQIHRDGRR